MPSPEPSTVSPLAAIRDRERALAQQISAAQTRANASIAEARARADALTQKAEQDGLRDADKLYQDGLARAREESAVAAKTGEAQAARLHDLGMQRLADAVNYIVKFVLPQER